MDDGIFFRFILFCLELIFICVIGGFFNSIGFGLVNRLNIIKVVKLNIIYIVIVLG